MSETASLSDEGGVLLREPAHRVSPRAIRYWTVGAIPGWVVLLAGEVVAAVLLPNARGWLLAALAVTAVIATAHVVVMPRWRYAVHRWEATPTAVYTQSGWVTQDRRIAPVSRIQTVDTQRGPLERLFDLASVTVTTASAAGPLHIGALDRRTAEELAARLTQETSSTPGDAT